MKELICAEAAGVDCDEVIRGEDEDEVMQKAARHGREKHDIEDLSPEQRQEIREKIRTV